MTPHDLCRSLIRLADSIPSGVPWGVVGLADVGFVFIHDRREESTTVITEAVAEKFGEVVATESLPSMREGRGPILGCLIRVDLPADDIEGEVRAAYAVATTEDSDGGPF